jgi:hypothetical protein
VLVVFMTSMQQKEATEDDGKDDGAGDFALLHVHVELGSVVWL